MTYFNHVSDLSNSWLTARNSRGLRAELDVKARELTTGERRGSEIARNGETGRLDAIDRSLELLAGFGRTIAHGRARAEATQATLQSIRTATSDIMVGVLSLAQQDSFQSADIQAGQAVSELHRVVASLNGNVAGHSLFSGAATDRAAVTDAATMLSDIEAILSAAPDVATALTNVDFYFSDPAGGYMTGIYTGATSAGPDVSVGEGQTVGFDVRADDPAIRETLRNLTLVAAVANGAYGGSLQDKKALFINAGQTNLATSDNLIRLQERLGYAEEQLALAITTNEAQRLRLELSRNEIATVDTYEAAARFQELEGQVERLYTVTARLGALSLANFLR